MSLDHCPKHPDTRLVIDSVRLSGWCPKCRTWRNVIDGGDVIEAYENQIKRKKADIDVLERHIQNLKKGPRGRRNPAMKKGQVPRRLSTGLVCGQAQGEPKR